MAEHIGEIDYMRAFAVLSVVMIHVTAAYTRFHDLNFLVIILVYINNFSSYAVTAFVIISGFVLSIKYVGKYNVKDFYCKRFLSIVPAYVIFTIFYMWFRKMNINTDSVIQSLLTASGHYHLYFILLMIELYLLYPILNIAYEFFEKRNHTIVFLILNFAFFLVLNNFSLIPSNWSNVYFPSYIIYFVLGMYAYRNFKSVDKMVKNIPLSVYIVFIGLAVGEYQILTLNKLKFIQLSNYGWPKSGILWTNFNLLLNMARILCIIIVLYQISVYYNNHKGKVSLFLRKTGDYSFGIYLIHLFFIVEIAKILSHMSITYIDPIYYAIMFGLVVASSFITVFLLGFLPFSKYIIGSTSKLTKPSRLRGG